MAIKRKRKGNRWYDKLEQVVRAVELLESLPDTYRQILASSIIQYIEDHSLLGTSEELKSFGHNKVLGLIQSKAKRRWYDQNKILHKAVNNYLLVNDRDRDDVTYRVIVSVESIEIYAEQKEKEEELPDADEVDQVINDIFSRPLDELVDLTSKEAKEKRELLKSTLPGFQEDEEEEDDSSAVVDDDSEEGMKLSAIGMEDSEES